MSSKNAARNIEIYLAVICDWRQIKDVAKEHGLSHPAARQIVYKVHREKCHASIHAPNWCGYLWEMRIAFHHGRRATGQSNYVSAFGTLEGLSRLSHGALLKTIRRNRIRTERFVPAIPKLPIDFDGLFAAHAE